MKDSANTRYLEHTHIPTRRSLVSPFLLHSSGSHQHSHLFFPILIHLKTMATIQNACMIQ